MLYKYKRSDIASRHYTLEHVIFAWEKVNAAVIREYNILYTAAVEHTGKRIAESTSVDAVRDI